MTTTLFLIDCHWAHVGAAVEELLQANAADDHDDRILVVPMASQYGNPILEWTTAMDPDEAWEYALKAQRLSVDPAVENPVPPDPLGIRMIRADRRDEAYHRAYMGIDDINKMRIAWADANWREFLAEGGAE